MVFMSPLEQFEVLPVLGVFSNLSLYIFFYAMFMVVLVTTYANSVLRYMFKPYFGKVLDIFILSFSNLLFSMTSFGNFFLFFYLMTGLFILFSNVFGILPLGFTTTAHLVVSFSWSFFLFAWMNSLFFLRFFLEWGSLFLPSGTPNSILFLMVPIETLSYTSSLLSLSMRLFANMMSGHTLMHMLISFFYMNLSPNFFLLIPFMIIHLIMYMEVGVAFLQVYVFVVLIGLYLNDVSDVGTH